MDEGTTKQRVCIVGFKNFMKDICAISIKVFGKAAASIVADI
eukprot:CAMPEP_0172363948 /NCGR_PEP_ID=MMETSP1060-20121228/7190_1 /TAXON_ID=37318 /ORGANISM="Pseudo-nitzschia pungens, Strain cf. cingulata" /LENGTH=41 /DNA_ID= /DNA_START= /DNA_END= /DNA_ORIENTATION=